MVRCSFSNNVGEHDHRDLHKVYLVLVLLKQNGNINTLTFFNRFSVQLIFYSRCYSNNMKYNKAYYTVTGDHANTDTSRGRHRSLRRFWKGKGGEPRKHYCACAAVFSRLHSYSCDSVSSWRLLEELWAEPWVKYHLLLPGANTSPFGKCPRRDSWLQFSAEIKWVTSADYEGPEQTEIHPVCMSQRMNDALCIYTASVNHPHHVIFSCRTFSFLICSISYIVHLWSVYAIRWIEGQLAN